MNILGLNAYHGDSSACLIQDGQLVAAVEEERYRRIKHWAGVPTQAIAYCLQAGGIAFGDLDHIAINTQPGANRWRRTLFGLRSLRHPALIRDRLRRIGSRTAITEVLQAHFNGQAFKGELDYVRHHHAHLASAFLPSPFRDAVAVSVDGFGDFASTAWGLGSGDRVSLDAEIHFPHSLGIFYQAMTQYLGFPNYGDEYKIMGLAPYGRPAYKEQMEKILRVHADGRFSLNLDYFTHHEGGAGFSWEEGAPTFGPLYRRATMEALLGPVRQADEALTEHHRNIAASIQQAFEQAYFTLLGSLHERYRLDAVAVAGGCAMNSAANGKITRNTPFKRLYVQAAAGDAGGAVGAAMLTQQRVGPEAGRIPMIHAYWGDAYQRPELDDARLARQELEGEDFQTEYLESDETLCERTARAIAEGKVVGWFQGRMEWGPRALGNRSIVCDPRRGDMKDILNAKIKRRESFRPFAPSVLRDDVPEWFEVDDEVPFMMKVFPIRETHRTQVPAVTHVDGSGRLQTVTAEGNPLYHRLIESFKSLTGVPMVLNTSFNENEPIVRTPAEALDCFLRTRMDVLVLGPYFIQRHSGDR